MYYYVKASMTLETTANSEGEAASWWYCSMLDRLHQSLHLTTYPGDRSRTSAESVSPEDAEISHKIMCFETYRLRMKVT